jgi:hypothetical protein
MVVLKYPVSVYLSVIMHSLKGSELPGPESEQAAEDQWTWLEATLVRDADVFNCQFHAQVA